MPYKIEFDLAAEKDVKTLYRKHKHLISRFEDILETLRRDPLEPSHNFEPLKHRMHGYFSRRLDGTNRVVYKMDGKLILVYIVQCLGHY